MGPLASQHDIPSLNTRSPRALLAYW